MPDVTNGDASPADTADWATSYTVTCDEGYELADSEAGSISGACGTDGNFASPAPSCQS